MRNTVTLLDIRRRLAALTASLATGPALEDVHPFTLGSNWSDNDEGAGWWQDSQGQVHCRGVLYYAGGGGANNPVDFPGDVHPTVVNMWGSVTAQKGADNTTYVVPFTIGGDGQLFLQPIPPWAGAPNFGSPPADTLLYMSSVPPFRVDQ